jgi:S-adenosylmethionine hydrolase
LAILKSAKAIGQNSTIALLTDFGLSDVYVGVMKGAIAQINPHLTIIDITHHIPAQNISAGRFCLLNAYPYFPLGTVFVAVVDPGVGGSRKAIAIQLEDGFLVGPDNGIFSGVLSQSPAILAVELTNRQYWRTAQPSHTFHGRDIFAPVAAHLASGVPLILLGEIINPATLINLPIPPLTFTDGIVGCIQYIDGYGNLIANIPASVVAGKSWQVEIKGKIIDSGEFYGASLLGEAIALIGSHGWVEIAVNGGSAQSQLKLNCGDRVKLLLDI